MKRLLCAMLAATLVVATAGCDDGSAWDYVALGDSLATGFGGLAGYAPIYAVHLRTDTGADIDVTNLGHEWWTSGNLLEALRTDEEMRRVVRDAEVLTFNIGGNDLRVARNQYIGGTCGGDDNQECLDQTLETFKTNWDAILEEIQALRGEDQAAIRTMTVYYPFVEEDRQAGRYELFRPFVKQVNEHIVTTAEANGIAVADVFRVFNGPEGTIDPDSKGLIGPDGIHPNDLGYKVIADLLAAEGYAPLVE